jgi:hypothetical protein
MQHLRPQGLPFITSLLTRRSCLIAGVQARGKRIGVNQGGTTLVNTTPEHNLIDHLGVVLAAHQHGKHKLKHCVEFVDKYVCVGGWIALGAGAGGAAFEP